MDTRSTLARGAAALVGAIAILTASWLPPAAAARRAPAARPTTTFVEVKVADDAAPRVEGDQVVSGTGQDLTDLDDALDSPEVVDAAPLLGDLAADADAQYREAPSTNPDAGNPASWLRLEVHDDEAATVVARLRDTPGVEDAYVAPRPPPPPTTPSFVDRETQNAPAPDGLGLTRAAVLRNANGKGVRIADIEYSWNIAHEDLSAARAAGSVVKVGTPVDPFADDDHGTAVAGILSGDDNGLGVLGEAVKSRLFLVNANSAEQGWSVAAAITAARKKLVPGDVILIEQQVWGVGDDLVPVEWNAPTYDAIASATAAGYVVVEAAANGGVDLDAAPYGGPFPAGKADSGAIIVGAGSACAPGFARQRLYFSDFGSRVDVQGPGECVTGTGYGDLYDGGPNATYTATFNGTSSASAVIAGAAAALSAGYEGANAVPPTPAQVRSLLVSHSTPQGTASSGHIGPLPDVYAALLSIDHTPPSTPTNVAVKLNGKNQPVITWKASTDNQALLGYGLLRDGRLVGYLTKPTFADLAAPPGAHSYFVFASDYAGNYSAPSTTVTITRP